MESIQLTEAQVQGLRWEVIEQTEDFRRSRAVYGQGPNGPVYAYRTEVLMPEGFLEANKAERNATEGTRWDSGMGSDKNGNVPMVKVAAIPLNKWFQHFGHGASGDQDKKKWLLNRDDMQPFRTRTGKL